MLKGGFNRNAKQPTSYRIFNDDNNDDGDELDSDTIDSVLLSDEDGNLDDDDDDSHDKLDIDTNDSDLQSNEGGEEALLNNNDLKPSARHTVLPPPPCLCLTMRRRKRKRRRRRSLRTIIQSIIQTMRRQA